MMMVKGGIGDGGSVAEQLHHQNHQRALLLFHELQGSWSAVQVKHWGGFVKDNASLASLVLRPDRVWSADLAQIASLAWAHVPCPFSPLAFSFKQAG